MAIVLLFFSFCCLSPYKLTFIWMDLTFFSSISHFTWKQKQHYHNESNRLILPHRIILVHFISFRFMQMMHSFLLNSPQWPSSTIQPPPSPFPSFPLSLLHPKRKMQTTKFRKCFIYLFLIQ